MDTTDIDAIFAELFPAPVTKSDYTSRCKLDAFRAGFLAAIEAQRWISTAEYLRSMEGPDRAR